MNNEKITLEELKDIMVSLRLRIEANEKDAIEENNRKFDGKSEFNRGWASAMATTASFIKKIERNFK